MAQKEGGVAKKGHEEGMEMAIALLQEFGLPLGLLPLEDVIEVGFVRDTGYMWIVQKKKVEHNFKMIKKLVSYDTQITGFVDKNQIKKLKGIKAKELMLWPPVNEIIVDDPTTRKIHFKSLAGVTKTFPLMHLLLGSKN
ncbi:phospholipase A1-IIgamma-like [Hibiscus syriacus]|uniref:Phospholipase A1-IIgamma-like n=1 Tax=Hibiscus syriacus TaxID=106335 RepID=A0A6A2XGT2_HIBSY|nr:phospholipase A1-IIgamma-like [Hibiscus syriacus]